MHGSKHIFPKTIITTITKFAVPYLYTAIDTLTEPEHNLPAMFSFRCVVLLGFSVLPDSCADQEKLKIYQFFLKSILFVVAYLYNLGPT